MITTCSTNLITADSVLTRAKADRELDAGDHFQTTVDRFCNVREIHFSKAPLGCEDATPFMRAWEREANKYKSLVESKSPETFDPGSESKPEDFFEELSPMFLNWLSNDKEAAGRVHRWLKFQLKNEGLVKVFWQGGNKPEQVAAAFAAVRAAARPDVENHPLWKALRAEPIEPADSYHGYFAKTGLNWRDNAVGYAFFAFAKGRDYAERKPVSAEYNSHWLRDKAIHLAGKSAQHRDGNDHLLFFPWGALLRDLYEDTGLLLECSATDEALTMLREQTLATRILDVLAGSKTPSAAVDYLDKWAASILKNRAFRPVIRTQDEWNKIVDATAKVGAQLCTLSVASYAITANIRIPGEYSMLIKAGFDLAAIAVTAAVTIAPKMSARIAADLAGRTVLLTKRDLSRKTRRRIEWYVKNNQHWVDTWLTGTNR